jgi:hypothetical protein
MKCNCDKSLKSFLFTLKNPHTTPARRFALNAEKKQWAIFCDSSLGPGFGGGANIAGFGNCTANTDSDTILGDASTKIWVQRDSR